MIRFFLYSLLIVASFLTTGCGGGNGASEVNGGDTLTHESQLLTLVDHGDYILADVTDPWRGGILQRYVLAPRDYRGELPEGAVVVRVPLERSVVYSGVYSGAISELGAVDAIKGVADGGYFTSSEMQQRIRSGVIRDIGNSSSPSVETLVDLDPDAILLSPYQDQKAGAVETLGVPLVQMVDYMESTPLARAEWIRLIGRLYGQGDRADSIYLSVAESYRLLCKKVAESEDRPVVITELPQPGGVWYIPAGQSYMAQMLADAGARYPWADTEGGGSLALDEASMLEKGRDADYWIIRNYGQLSRSVLLQSEPLLEHFRALSQRGVYVCDTSVSPLFDEFPFHPERLLADYIAIFHPAATRQLRYFNQLK